MSDAISIRELTAQADYDACVALQHETWGRNFKDAVPASIMHVSQRLGGVAAGAFDGGGRLVGFVFGMTGVENGAIVHWSDMLAVRPEAQNIGIGRRLKEFQRQAVARLGARVIYWTFDPLVARNAHLNFNVFGVRAVEYTRNMYGDATGSDLHRGIGTDRLIVAWPVNDDELAQRKREIAAAHDGARLRTAPAFGDPDESASRWPEGIRHIRIAVPADIATLQTSRIESAMQWRDATRAAFEAALGSGFTIDAFELDTARRRGYYLLRRNQV